jgi:hypothetical protein
MHHQASVSSPPKRGRRRPRSNLFLVCKPKRAGKAVVRLSAQEFSTNHSTFDLNARSRASVRLTM